VIGTLADLSVASAEGSSTSHGEGGYVPHFIAIVHRYDATGEPFRIEGTCKSACTIFLGIRNACVERSATLMFHAGHDIRENATGSGTWASRAALFHYNAAIRRYLLDGHYLDSDAYHSVPGSTLIDRFGFASVTPNPNDLIAFGPTEVPWPAIIAISSPVMPDAVPCGPKLIVGVPYAGKARPFGLRFRRRWVRA
jgi:hypothetical protein